MKATSFLNADFLREVAGAGHAARQRTLHEFHQNLHNTSVPKSGIGGNMLLAKTTNIDTGAQSEAFTLCADCYEKLDDALTHANAKTHTDIALATVAEDVEGVCEQCEKRR